MTTTEITGFASFNGALNGDMTFLKERDPEKAALMLRRSKAARIFVHRSIYKAIQDRIIHSSGNNSLLYSLMNRIVPAENPRLEFIKEMLRHENLIEKNLPKGPMDQRAHNNYIPESTRVFHPSLIENTTFGENCMIYPGVTIGFPALAVERDEDGTLYDFPHIGRVRIGNNVTVCSQANISRGSLNDTIISDGVRIDSQVHIAHNCVIGQNCLLTASATFGGSCVVGDNCWFGLNCTISDHVTIANNVLVAAGAMVTKNITTDNDVVAGVPARSIKDKINLSSEKKFLMVGYH